MSNWEGCEADISDDLAQLVECVKADSKETPAELLMSEFRYYKLMGGKGRFLPPVTEFAKACQWMGRA